MLVTASGLAAITDGEFVAFQQLVQAESGIFLGPSKRALLVGRLARRLRALGMTSFAEYRRVVADDADERARMLEALTTHETHFFREPAQFDLLERRVYPTWVRRRGPAARRIRAWSAACSTGEEPYSLAMTLRRHFPPSSGWDSQVLATDLSRAVLAQAEAGVWPISRAEEIPDEYLKRFMLRGTGSQIGKMKAAPELRSVLRFRHFNLAAEEWKVEGPLDLILCRNVLIYFGAEAKRRVVERLLGLLAPAGLLLLGHAESLSGFDLSVRSLAPAVYARADAPPEELP